MKRVCTALLIVLCSAVCSPLTVCDISHEEGSFLMALDVCDSSASHASVNADSPAIQEYPCHLLHPACSGYAEVSDPEYKPVVAAFKQERPPQVQSFIPKLGVFLMHRRAHPYAGGAGPRDQSFPMLPGAAPDVVAE